MARLRALGLKVLTSKPLSVTPQRPAQGIASGAGSRPHRQGTKTTSLARRSKPGTLNSHLKASTEASFEARFKRQQVLHALEGLVAGHASHPQLARGHIQVLTPAGPERSVSRLLWGLAVDWRLTAWA